MHQLPGLLHLLLALRPRRQELLLACRRPWLQLPGLPDETSLRVETSYDAANRPVEIAYPAALATRYTYGAGGLLDTVEVDAGEGSFRPVVRSFRYNARRQLTSVTFGKNTWSFFPPSGRTPIAWTDSVS